MNGWEKVAAAMRAWTICLAAAACGGAPPVAQPSPPVPAPPPPARAELAGTWVGRVTDDDAAGGGAMRIQWTLGSSRVLDGTWTWSVDGQPSVGGTVRALELGEPVIAAFTPRSPLVCPSGETIPVFSASVRMQEGRLAGTFGPGVCELRRFDLVREPGGG